MKISITFWNSFSVFVLRHKANHKLPKRNISNEPQATWNIRLLPIMRVFQSVPSQCSFLDRHAIRRRLIFCQLKEKWIVYRHGSANFDIGPLHPVIFWNGSYIRSRPGASIWRGWRSSNVRWKCPSHLHTSKWKSHLEMRQTPTVTLLWKQWWIVIQLQFSGFLNWVSENMRIALACMLQALMTIHRLIRMRSAQS